MTKKKEFGVKLKLVVEAESFEDANEQVLKVLPKAEIEETEELVRS